MTKRAKSGGKLRLAARTMVLGCLSLVLLLLSLAAWCNWVGVPDWCLASVHRRLRKAGWDCDWQRVALHGFNGWRVEDLLLAPKGSGGAGWRVAEIDCQWRPALLLRGEFPIAGLELRGLGFIDLTSSTVPVRLLVNFPRATLRFHRSRLELADCSGQFRGAEISITGTLDHFRELRWPKPAEGGRPIRFLAKDIERWLSGFQFKPRTKLSLAFAGDGRDWSSLKLEGQFDSPQADFPGGKMIQGQARLNLGQARKGAWEGKIRFRCARVSRRGLTIEGGQCRASFVCAIDRRRLTECSAELAASQFGSAPLTLARPRLSLRGELATNRTWHTMVSGQAIEATGDWGKLHRTEVTAELENRDQSVWPERAWWKISAAASATRWAKSGAWVCSGNSVPPEAQPPASKADWGFWAKLPPLDINWALDVRALDSPKLEVAALNCAGQWRAPRLVVPNCQAELGSGKLEAALELDVASREFRSRSKSDFELHRLSPLFTTNAQLWMKQLAWEKPARIEAEVRMKLPPWTNAHPDWRAVTAQSLRAAGQFSTGPASFRGMPFQAARSHFTLTNLVWDLPDLTITRPEGQARLGYLWHMRTHQYRWSIDSALDLNVLRPILEAKERKALDLFSFSQPPRFRGVIEGRWHKPEETGFQGDLLLREFQFRGEHCDRLQAGLSFTNQFLVWRDLRIEDRRQKISAPAGWIDFPRQLLSVSNAICTVDPRRIAHAIGPHAERDLSPYWFDTPPAARVSGQFPIGKKGRADVRLTLAGGGFHYRKLRAPQISGDLAWQGQILTLTNVQAGFYNGGLVWSGRFDFSPKRGADFRFQGKVNQADLHQFISDVGSPTNRLRGTLDGTLAITSANSEDKRSWNGFGQFRLSDGFLWDIPLFSFLTPVLEKISPTLANSPIHEGATSFTIKNSVIRTRDLELRSPAMRLNYSGTIGFDGKVDVRLEAEILRDVFVVGPLFSLAFWPITKAFEYKVAGTINQPKAEPLYLPKILLLPLHPLRSFQKTFSN